MRRRIYVSQADIANGVRMRTDLCPIACALRRRGYQDVLVRNTEVNFGDLFETSLPPGL